jgi:hypothetical protein
LADFDSVFQSDNLDHFGQLFFAIKKDRQVLGAAMMSLKAISAAVIDESDPVVRTVLRWIRLLTSLRDQLTEAGAPPLFRQ